MRIFRALSSSAAIKDERSCVSAHIISRTRSGQSENERLRRELHEAHATIRLLKAASAPTRDRMQSTDDSTVVSNASTVKAGTCPKRHITSAARAAHILKAPTLSTAPSVASEPVKRKRHFFFRKSRNETLLSEAALKFEQQDNEVATKTQRQQQKLSLPMKRYLCNFDSPPCSAVASDTTSATCDMLAEF